MSVQLVYLGVSLGAFVASSKIAPLWWFSIFGFALFGIFLSAPPSSSHKAKHFLQIGLCLIALRFLLHLAVNSWVFTGYARLVSAGPMQTLVFCLLVLLVVSAVAFLAVLPQFVRLRANSGLVTFLAVLGSLLIWERISIVFPMSSFTLYGNSSFALKAVSHIGLDILRIALMASAALTGLLWWRKSLRKFSVLPSLIYLLLLWIGGVYPVHSSGTACSGCFPEKRNIELIQLMDAHNGGADLNGAKEKIEYVKGLPPVEFPTWTIWPEGAFDQVDSFSPQFEALISEMSSQKNRIHFFGGIRSKGDFRTPTTFIVNAQGLVAEQGKLHPFPIGEASPFPEFMTTWGLVADKTRIIRAAPTHQLITLPEEPKFVFVTFICSDALDEAYVRKTITEAKKTGKTPIVIQILNDSWFDGTYEPIQHSDVVRLWAAELGVYWLRAGMTAQTQIISPQGDLIQKSSDGVRQIVQGQLGPCLQGSTGQCLDGEMKEPSAQ